MQAMEPYTYTDYREALWDTVQHSIDYWLEGAQMTKEELTLFTIDGDKAVITPDELLEGTIAWAEEMKGKQGLLKGYRMCRNAILAEDWDMATLYHDAVIVDSAVQLAAFGCQRYS